MNIEKVNAMANVLLAMRETFFPDRNTKDDIVKRASDVIISELKDGETERT